MKSFVIVHKNENVVSIYIIRTLKPVDVLPEVKQVKLKANKNRSRVLTALKTQAEHLYISEFGISISKSSHFKVPLIFHIHENRQVLVVCVLRPIDSEVI